MAKIPLATQEISVINPQTGETVDQFSTTQAAYQAGALPDSTLSGLMDAMKVYEAGPSKWTTAEPAQASVSLNKLTGDIDVVVPSSVANDEEFKAALSDLETLSSNYKLNPNATFTYKQDANDDGEELTVEEYINRINTPVDTGTKDLQGNPIKVSAFQSQVNGYLWANSVRELIAPQYQQIDAEGNITPVHLSRADLVRLTTNGLQDGANGTKRVAVPKGMEQFKNVYKLNSWDEDTSTVEVQEFLDTWYNREKTNKEELITTFGELGRYLADAKNSPTEDYNVDTEKWTATYALYTYLATNDPTCSLLRGIGEVALLPFEVSAGAVVNQIGTLAGLAGYAVDVIRNIYEKGLSENPFIPRDKVDSARYQWLSAIRETMDLYGFEMKWRDYPQGLFQKDLDKAADLKAELDSTNMTLQGLIGIGVDEQTAENFYKNGLTPRLNSGVEAAEGFVQRLVEMGIGIHVGNVLSEAFAGGALTVANAIKDGSAAIKAGVGLWATFEGAQAIVPVLNGLAVASSTVGATLIGFLGESIGEGLFIDPAKTAQVLTSDDLTVEARDYLWETYLGNAVAAAVVTGAAKAVYKLGEIPVIQGISKNLSNKLTGWQTKAADMLDGVRVKVSGSEDVNDWLNKIGSRGITPAGKAAWAKKAAIMAQQRSVRTLRELVAENSPKIKILGETGESILKQIDEAEKYITGLQDYEDALDRLLRGPAETIARWTGTNDYPLFKLANNTLNTRYAELLELQQEMGLRTAKKQLLSTELKDYLTARRRVLIGNSMSDALKAQKTVDSLKESEKITKEINYWNEVIQQFEAKATPEIISKTNQFLTAEGKWWSSFNNLRIKEGLLDPYDVEKARESGLWGKNGELYGRQQRQQELKNYYLARRDGKVTKDLVRDMGRYNWGSTDPFVDPMLVMTQELNMAAEQYNRLEVQRTFDAMKGTATRLATAEDVRVVKEIKPYLQKYNNEAHRDIKALVDEFDTDGIFANAIKRKELADIARKVERTQTQALKRTTRVITKGEAQSVILNLDEDSIQQLWRSTYGAKSIEEVLTEEGKAVNTNPPFLDFDVSPPSIIQKEDALNQMTPAGFEVTPEYADYIGGKYPNTLDGVDLDLSDKVLLHDRDLSSSSSSIGLDETIARKGDLSGIKPHEFISSQKGKAAGVEITTQGPMAAQLSRKVYNNPVRRPELYRIEPVAQQSYEVGDVVDMPLTSFSSSSDIISSNGRYVTTQMFNPTQDHYFIKIEPGEIGSIDISEFSTYPEQKELLVSDRFEVVSRKQIDTPHGMLPDDPSISPNTYEITLRRIPSNNIPSEREILMNSKVARESTYMKDVVIPAREMQVRQTLEFAYGEDLAESAATLAERAEIQVENQVEEILNSFKEDFFAKGTNAAKVGDEVALRYGGDAPDAVKEYLYYDALKHNKASLSKRIRDRAEKYFKGYEVEVNGKATHPYRGQANRLANQLSKQVSNRIEVEYNLSRNTVSNMGGDAAKLIDHESWQREIYETADKIADLRQESNVMFMRNESGQVELIQVDPLLAIFLNSSTQYAPMGVLQKANYLMMRLFRLGTTGMNPASWVSQGFRDTGNAWVMGDISQTLARATDELAEIFGENPGVILSQYSAETQEALVKLAKEQDKTIGRVLAEEELSRGKIYANTSSETAQTKLWRGSREQWYTESGKPTLWDKTMDWLDRAEEKLGVVNEARETYLRNLVYGNNFAAAIKGGKSIEQARTFATYIASNATTNFSRGVAFLSQFQNTIPYFRSAINGARSFYRLWSLDPVGVSGRIMGGIILPAFSLTMWSLSSEENRKAYSRVQAYQKENALPIAYGGEVFFIPLPQELAVFVAPFRQAAEAISGLGYNNALEVITNDILAMSPLDFGGFTDIDSWRIYGEGADWTDRLTAGSAQLFSQIAPKYLVSLATLASGRDLYTGNKIDTSYVTVDPETGEARTMSYTAGAFASALNKVFPNWPAPIVQEALDNIFGTAGAAILDFLVDAAEETVTGNFNYLSTLETGLKGTAESLAKPIKPYVEDRAESDWRRAISELWDMRNDILNPTSANGQAWQSYLKNKRNAQTQTQKDAASAARANILDPFYAQVKDTVGKLVQAYPELWTDYKLASVISLMNFQQTTETGNAALDQANSDAYKQARYGAIETMVKLGFPNTTNPCLLGSIKVSQQTGQSYISWNTPLQILDIENSIYARGDIYAADLKNLLTTNGLTSAGRQQVLDAYYATNDKTKRQQLATEWDTKVALAIAPYIQQHGAEVVTSANAVVDYLDGMLIIPTDYMKYNGKSTYNPKVDAPRGYSKSFIKSIFGAKK